MFINVSQTKSGRYIFNVGDNPTDGSRCWINSLRDAALLGDTPATFSSFGEAYAFASRFADGRPSAIVVKKISGMYSVMTETSSDDAAMLAEGDVLSHYAAQVEAIIHRVEESVVTHSKSISEELNALVKEIESVKKELQNLHEMASEEGKTTFIDMIGKLEDAKSKVHKCLEAKTAQTQEHSLNTSIARAAIRAFSESAMLTLQPLHKDIFVRAAFSTPKGYESVLSTPAGDVARLLFDKHLLLSGVYPCGQSLLASNGLHEETFLNRYWEPIVHAVGHFHSKSQGVVAVSGMGMDKRYGMSAFGMEDNSLSKLIIEHPVVMGSKTWTLKRVGATITTPPSSEFNIDDEVVCVDETLPTYVGSTGVVDAIKQTPSRTLLRIDFRRGLGIVWLSSDSIRKFDIGH